MEIKLNPNVAPVAPADRKRVQTAKDPIVKESASFQGTDALNQALANTPSVRTAAVERAKELVSGPNYPPPELINGVARLLATRLNKTDA
jgi:hypothetical protein